MWVDEGEEESRRAADLARSHLPLAWLERLIPATRRATDPVDALRQRLLIASGLIVAIVGAATIVPLVVADPTPGPAWLVAAAVVAAMLATPLWVGVAGPRRGGLVLVLLLNLALLFSSATLGVAGPLAPFLVIIPALAVLLVGVAAGWINAALLAFAALAAPMVGVDVGLASGGAWLLTTSASLALLAVTSVFASLHARQSAGFAADRENALALSSAKSRFLSVMSHELRTPMVGVLGAAELLERTDDRGEQRRLIRILRRSAQSQLELIGNILDLSRIEADQLQIERASLDLRRVFHDVEAMFRAPAENKGLALRVVIEDAIPARIVGDAFRLQQILGNLVNNAIKFTERGEISMSARTLRDDRVELVVRDTGVGFSDDVSDDIFATFVQADSTTARRFGGSGLGLAICRRLVAALGGTIEAKSVPGRGSTFVVTLPAPEPSDSAELAISRDTPATSSSSLGGRSLSVLVTDDELVNRVVISAMLTSLGYRVLEAADGYEALALLDSEAIDAVILDMHMPGLDGPAVMSRIRGCGDRRAELPVIGLTADVVPENLHRYAQSGLTAILSKPIGVEGLREAIEAALEPGAAASARGLSAGGGPLLRA
ncbi:MAG: response regulator [Myxococcales bacterium]|nr:response regulator [Myxococcales bacterium]